MQVELFEKIGNFHYDSWFTYEDNKAMFIYLSKKAKSLVQALEVS